MGRASPLTTEERTRIVLLTRAGRSTSEIAAMLGRVANTIRHAQAEMGIRPKQARPWLRRPDRPSDAGPGTVERLREMQRRESLGMRLWHPEDAIEGGTPLNLLDPEQLAAAMRD